MNKERNPSSSLELDMALEYYRDVFSGDQDIDLKDCVVGMEIGQSGWSAYWSVERDTSDRYWLSPLFKFDFDPFDSAVHIRREVDGYHADFSDRVLLDNDQLYDSLVSSDQVDEILTSGRPYGLPVVEVLGPEYLKPGFFSLQKEQKRSEKLKPLQ